MTEKAHWYWATLALVVATALTTFLIPENVYPFAYIRQVLGIIFVLWFPGYCFTKALFPCGAPPRRSTMRARARAKAVDPIERIALSIGLSLALVPIMGLILNYTPLGIRLAPLVLSLLSLTMVFATAGIIREHRKMLE